MKVRVPHFPKLPEEEPRKGFGSRSPRPSQMAKFVSQQSRESEYVFARGSAPPDLLIFSFTISDSPLLGIRG